MTDTLPGFTLDLPPNKSRYTAKTWIANNRDKCEQLLDLFFNRNQSRRAIARQLDVSREIVAAVIDAFRRNPTNDAPAFFLNSLPLAKRLKHLVAPLDDYIDERVRQAIEDESLSLNDAIQLREKIQPHEQTKPQSREVPNEIIDYDAFVNGLVGGKKGANENEAK